MIPVQRRRGVTAMVGTIGLLAVAGAARAQIEVTPSVTSANGLYSYDYTVANNSPDDVYDIAITVTPGPDTVQNLMVPTGFMDNYDPILGIVDFISDTSVFGAGTTLSDFDFDSPLAPQTTTFAALTFNGTVTGITQSAFVPEPGLPALLAGCGALGLYGWRFSGPRRKTRTAA